jgi:ATP-dependent DNA helicase RecG
VLSVYPATEGFSFKQLRALIERHLDEYLPLFKEHIPADLLVLAGVPPLPEALRAVHRPRTLAEAHAGRARLAFEELLSVHILQLRAKALAREARAGITFVNKRVLTSRLKTTLPFELTGAQVRATREIVKDMTGPLRMHRLLQGDVGSGKTIVALFASLLAVENDYQAAIMAPTELLAEQHARTFATLLAPLGMSPLLITGSQSARERKAAATRLASSEPLVVVGTHALAQEATKFAKLGLAIVDEQHRFGVSQRLAFGKKGERPDVLLMSATPIPRSLALTLYGDLDVSVLDERPPGRQPVTTAMRPEKARAKVLDFVDAQVAKGRQAYIVFPLIDESDKSALKAATKEFEALRTGRFASRRVALLHGRLDTEEKDETMRRFRGRELLHPPRGREPGSRGAPRDLRRHRRRIRDRRGRSAPARDGRPFRRAAERGTDVPRGRSDPRPRAWRDRARGRGASARRGSRTHEQGQQAAPRRAAEALRARAGALSRRVSSGARAGSRGFGRKWASLFLSFVPQYWRTQNSTTQHSGVSQLEFTAHRERGL